MTDVIADMLTRIRNALTAKHEVVEIPASNTKKAIAKILLDEGEKYTDEQLALIYDMLKKMTIIVTQTSHEKK